MSRARGSTAACAGTACPNCQDLKPKAAKPAHKPFKAYEPGYLHIDVKYLPQMAGEEKRGGSRDPEDDEIEVKVDRFARTILDLDLGYKDHPDLPSVRVLCAHLKSRLPTRLDHEERDLEAVRKHASVLGAALSTIRRTAEAAAFRGIVNEILKKTDTPLVVLGDLNDAQLSNTLAIIAEQPSYRLFESSRVGFSSNAGLYAAGTLQEFRSLRDIYYTHEYKGVRESLDHVLVSKQFYDHSWNRPWSFKEMKVWNDHLEDEKPSSSDHGVVAAYFVHDPA